MCTVKNYTKFAILNYSLQIFSTNHLGFGNLNIFACHYLPLDELLSFADEKICLRDYVIMLSFRQYITVANLWGYPINHHVTFKASALEVWNFYFSTFMMWRLVSLKFYMKGFRLHGILGPPTVLITSWSLKNKILILKWKRRIGQALPLILIQTSLGFLFEYIWAETWENLSYWFPTSEIQTSLLSYRD